MLWAEYLILHGQLPHAAYVAATLHPELHGALATVADLGDEAFDALYRPGRLPDEDVAAGLCAKPLTRRQLSRVLAECREQRPAVLACVVRYNVPPRAWRRANRVLLHGPLASPVLGNPDWPRDEQVEVAAHAAAGALVSWLATRDPDADLAPAIHDAIARRIAVPDDRAGGWLDLATTLRALVRWPDLADWAARGLQADALTGTATVVTDPAVIAELIDDAARWVDPRLAPAFLEALWLNPALTPALRRRLKKAIRRELNVHYITTVAAPPTVVISADDVDPAEVARLVDWLETARSARHRTTWTAAHLAIALGEQLDDGLRRRLARLVAEDGRAAGMGPADAALVGRRLGLPVELAPLDDAALGGAGVGPFAGPGAWPTCGGIIDPSVAPHAEAAAVLTRWLGARRGAWDIVMTLALHGWDEGATTLAKVVLAVTGPEADHADAA